MFLLEKKFFLEILAKVLFDLLGRYCDKTPSQVMKDATRDFWLSAEEAVKYGIIDEVITKKDPKKK